MTNKNEKILKDSVLLLGPLGVGKSLLSTKIGEKLHLPVICLDQVFGAMSIFYRKSWQLPTFEEWEASQKPIFRRDMSRLDRFKYQKQISQKIVSDYEMLRSYQEIFDMSSLIEDCCCAMKNCYFATKNKDFQTRMFALIYTDTLLLEKIMSKLKEPVVLDASGIIGASLTLKEEINANDIHLDEGTTTYDFQRNVLSRFGTKVYICPGEDFRDRNDDECVEANKIILKSKSSYIKYCDIVASTNGIVYRDDPILLQKRNDYDIDKSLKFLKAQNLGEIENTTDQIVNSIKEFMQAKEDRSK